MSAPAKSQDFDDVYRSAMGHWVWTDLRIPKELKALMGAAPERALELGCGLGTFSRYVAQQGVRVTGVDFSPIAIARAKERAARDAARPEFLVGDVTRLEGITGPFDASFDVGCFHCLSLQAQPAYVAELARLLRPGATHLMWALNSSPSDLKFSPAVIRAVFLPAFELQTSYPARQS